MSCDQTWNSFGASSLCMYSELAHLKKYKYDMVYAIKNGSVAALDDMLRKTK